jgi:hypothetical protein
MTTEGDTMTDPQTPPSTLTCPAGHTFPYEQLTIRNGLSVCPLCDQRGWATPRKAWSRGLLVAPLVLLLGTVVTLFIETLSGVGIGTTYQNKHIAGAAWLTAGSIVNLVGAALIAAGIVRLLLSLRSETWARTMLSVPLFIMAAGAALLAAGDLVDIGLNVAFVNASQPGSGWQLFGQVFDTLFFGGLAGVLAWTGGLCRRHDALSG